MKLGNRVGAKKNPVKNCCNTPFLFALYYFAEKVAAMMRPVRGSGIAGSWG